MMNNQDVKNLISTLLHIEEKFTPGNIKCDVVNLEENSILVVCELPGVDSKTIQVKFGVNKIIVSAIKKPSYNSELQSHILRNEILYTNLTKEIKFENFTPRKEHTTLKYENGMLYITITKDENDLHTFTMTL